MHELPKDLTSSLRSFRRSISKRRDGGETGDSAAEIENGRGTTYVEKDFEDAMNATESSTSRDPRQYHSTETMEQPSVRHGDDYDVEAQKPVRSHGEPKSAADTKEHSEKRDSIDHTQTKSDIFDAPPVKDLDPAASRLALNLTPLSNEEFYDLIGMRPPTGPDQGLGQLATPHGLYNKIYKHMRYNNRKFKMFDIAAYFLLVVQIILSAIFIILGALHNYNTHLTISILGAVATVISGALALMKGQGLPNRLRQARDGLRDVMFEAEELWWDVRSGRPVLYKDIKKIREDFMRVLQSARQHHPDAWSGEAGIGSALGRGGAGKGGKR